MQIFTIHDAKAEFFMQPFFARSSGEAIRSFQEAINTPDHQFAKHAGDFTIFKIGEYDDQTGVITPLVPQSLGNGLEYAKPVA